jgi:uncharacterized membrane protein
MAIPQQYNSTMAADDLSPPKLLFKETSVMRHLITIKMFTKDKRTHYIHLGFVLAYLINNLGDFWSVQNDATNWLRFVVPSVSRGIFCGPINALVTWYISGAIAAELHQKKTTTTNFLGIYCTPPIRTSGGCRLSKLFFFWSTFLSSTKPKSPGQIGPRECFFY